MATPSSRATPPRRAARRPTRVPRVILQVQQPFANHNGGMLAFGPDGYLYIGIGRRRRRRRPGRERPEHQYPAGQDPAHRRRQRRRPMPSRPATLRRRRPAAARRDLGLRPAQPLALQLRPPTGDLYIGDVGQAACEEVDFQPAGGPGGTELRLADHGRVPLLQRHACDQSGLTLPSWSTTIAWATARSPAAALSWRGHANGGRRLPLRRLLHGAHLGGPPGWWQHLDAHAATRLAVCDHSFGEDQTGEVYSPTATAAASTASRVRALS